MSDDMAAKPQQRPQEAQARPAASEASDEKRPGAIQQPARPARQHPAPAPKQPPVRPGGQGRPPARPVKLNRMRARLKGRHLFLAISFFIVVVLPSLYANWYLQFKAADQYASTLNFTIKSDNSVPTIGVLEMFAGSAGGTADDAEVLYQFIQSQNLVQTLAGPLNLQEKYNKSGDDWFFALGEDATVEDLVDYWRDMVLVAFEAGIVEVEVRAFDPKDAQEIAQGVLRESTILINRLSEEARADAVREAAKDLQLARDNLVDIRQRMIELRRAEQQIDPSREVEAAMERLGSLEGALTSERLRLDQLLEFASESDSRVLETRRKIQSLQNLISAERASLASNGVGVATLSDSVSRFEELQVDKELAEQTYAVAQASHEAAKAEARRQQRFLSAHISPTLAQTAEYPKREILGGLVTFFLFMCWVVMTMIVYNIKDRR